VLSDVTRMGVMLCAQGLRHAGQTILAAPPAPTATRSRGGSSAFAEVEAALSTLPSSSAALLRAAFTLVTRMAQPAPAQAIQPGVSTVRYWQEAVERLGLVLPAVELPGGPGSEQACAAAKQKLLQLQGRVQQGLQDALAKVASTSSNGGSSRSAGVDSGDVAVAGSTPDQRSGSGVLGAATAAVAQQMEALGEALCAQLPLARCCNNPGCVELRGASELQLVGGKGSVCSRCRWVA
jgi:hypothetical protein